MPKTLLFRSILLFFLCSLFQGCQDFARVSYGNSKADILKSWRSSLPVTFQTSQSSLSTDAMEAYSAMDDNGNVILVWDQVDYYRSNIYKSEYRNGAWTHPASLHDHINPLGPGNAYGPKVVMNNAGVAIIAWAQEDGNEDRQIYKSEYRNGAWSHPANLADNISPDGSDSWYPEIALSSNGQAVIAWQQSNGLHAQVFKSEYRNGNWIHPSNLHDNISPDNQYTYNVLVRIDSAGNTLIGWAQSNSLNYQIFKSEYRNGAWTHPVDLNDNISPDGQDASIFDMDMDNNGSAIIAWVQSNTTHKQIFKSEYRLSAWTHPVDLNDNISPDNFHASDVAVAMDENNQAIITWSQLSGANYQMFKSEYRLNAWNHPVDINDYFSVSSSNAYNLDVAMSNNGDAVIVWEQSNGTHYQTFKSEYRASVWIHPSGLNDNISPDGSYSNAAHVSMDEDGNTIIAWRQYANYDYAIFMSEFRNNSWTHPADLTDFISPGVQMAQEPQLAVNDQGDAILAWQQYDGNINRIFKSELRDGNWIHPTGLSDGISPLGQSAYSPFAGIDNAGNALIMWMQSDGSRRQIFKSDYRAGTWTHPTSLLDNISPDGQDVGMPQTAMAMDKNGNALIVWQQPDGSRAQIFKSEYRLGAWTHPTGLLDNISPDGQHAYDPHVAMDDNNQAIIVWKQFDGSTNRMFKSEYRLDTWTHPTGLADNFSPAGYANYPKVAMDNNNNAIIIWMQNDGSFDQMFKSEFRSNTWTHPSGLTDNISPDGADVDYYSDVAMNQNNQIAITWSQSDGSTNQIFKSEFRDNNWYHPTDLQDNLSLNGVYAEYPKAAVTSEGIVHIVWESYLGVSGVSFSKGSKINDFTLPLGFMPNIATDAQGNALLVYANLGNSSDVNTGIMFKEFK